jgi:hypothetical protein
VLGVITSVCLAVFLWQSKRPRAEVAAWGLGAVSFLGLAVPAIAVLAFGGKMADGLTFCYGFLLVMVASTMWIRVLRPLP